MASQNQINIAISATTGKFEDGIRRVINSFNVMSLKVIALNQSFDLLFKGIDLAKRFGEAINEAAKNMDIRNVFASQIKDFSLDVDTALQKLRQATKYALSDIELMKRANAALFAGISFDDLTIALDYLQRYAQATGKSFEQLSDTIITGLVRGSTLMLDDAGIIIDQTEIINQKQQELGRTLSEQEKKGIVVAEAFRQMKMRMGELGGETNKATLAINKAMTTYQNFITSFQTLGLKAFALIQVSIKGYQLLWNAIRLGFLGLVDYISEKFIKPTQDAFDNMIMQILIKMRGFFISIAKSVPDFMEKSMLKTIDVIDKALVTLFDKRLNNKVPFDIDNRKAKINELIENEKQLKDEAAAWWEIMMGRTSPITAQKNLPQITSTKTDEKKKDDKIQDIKIKEGTAAYFHEQEGKDIHEYLNYINHQWDKGFRELSDKKKEIEDLQQSIREKFDLQALELMPNADLNKEQYKIIAYWDTKIRELEQYRDEFPDVVADIEKSYEELRQQELKYVSDTTLTDSMQQKISQIQGAFSALHDVFTTVGDALGRALADSFEKGFNFKEFISNLGKMLRMMSIQKTVSLLFEAAYQKIMAMIYQTLAVSNALANPALAAAYQKAAIGATVAASGALAGAAVMGSLATGLIAGMAHDGMANIPETGTWLLQKGERVVDAKTNKDLREYLKSADNKSINMTVNIYNSDEEGVLKALPQLKQTILEVVNGDIVSGGLTARTIRSYAR